MRMPSIAQQAASACALIALATASPSTALLLGAATGALLLAPAAAQAQSSQAAARAAQAITVRLEGATQGSGVLMKREGNRYTVLTAWHVVSAQRPGEELAIYTPDGRQHQLEAGSIRRLGNVDLAVLSFSSATAYETARVGDRGSVQMGSGIYVAGFPLPSTAVPTRLMRFLDGRVIANAQVAIPNGYQLLYSNPTLPGMSGGPVFNSKGEVVGIHGQGETDAEMSEQRGVAVKTGTNQGVPIAYYTQAMSSAGGSAAVAVATATASTADDYLAQAKQLQSESTEVNSQEIIRLTSLSLKQQGSAEAYTLRGFAKLSLNNQQGAIADASHAINLDIRHMSSYLVRGYAKSELGDKTGAINDYNLALVIDPSSINLAAAAYILRAIVKGDLGDQSGAMADFSQAIFINPQNYLAYKGRGDLKAALGDIQGAIADFNQALARDPRNSDVHFALGNAQLLLGQSEKALGSFEQAAKLRKDFWEPINNQGLVLWEAGRRPDALERWRRVLKIKPDVAETSLAMATGLFVTNPQERSEVLRLAEQALNEDPNYVLDSYQKEQLWGEKLRADTRRLLDQPQLKSAAERARAKIPRDK